MKTTIELKQPYSGFGYITIPKGTTVTTQRRQGKENQYHEVIDVAKVTNINYTKQEDRKRFFRSAVYNPIRIDARFVEP